MPLTWTSKNIFEQECIPVGCVPPPCCPYLPACTAPGGVYLVWVGVPGPGGTWSGVYMVPGGCTWSWGYLVRGAVPGPRGMYLVPSGVYLVPGGYLPRYSPPHEQNSWHTLLKILPCPKLRFAGGKDAQRIWKLFFFISETTYFIFFHWSVGPGRKGS